MAGAVDSGARTKAAVMAASMSAGQATSLQASTSTMLLREATGVCVLPPENKASLHGVACREGGGRCSMRILCG
jgi:hypothetical protein